jgi:hypothetical protein
MITLGKKTLNMKKSIIYKGHRKKIKKLKIVNCNEIKEKMKLKEIIKKWKEN